MLAIIPCFEQRSATLKMSIMVQLEKYWNVFRTGLLVLWVRLLLRLTNLPGVLERLSSRSARVTADEAEMKKMVYYVDRWLELFPYNQKGNCFPRSLALYRLARRRGYPVRFHCGVRKGLAGLEGHAWLTVESKTFCEPGNIWRGFTTTFSYPPDAVEPPEVLSVDIQTCNRWNPKANC